MAKAVILAVDDDPVVSRAITRDLRTRYGSEYGIIGATSGAEALTVLDELTLRDKSVALVASDQRMPRMTGIELFEEVHRRLPEAKLLLLTAYADTDVAIRAINDIGLDYYMLKPWDPPEERLYPVIDDLLGDWLQEHPSETSEVRVIGHRWSDHTHDVKTFLARNHVPYRWIDVERGKEAERLLELADMGTEDLPAVLLPDGRRLRIPSAIDLADALGLRTRAEQPLYDLCIVGGGPAGLAAAVYAASEGLKTVVVERDAPGGQAGQSASIENYLGFPKGLSGADLTHRAVAQATRFGAEMVLARDVVGLEPRGPVRAVRLEGAGDIEGRAVLIATGVSYRRLEARGLEELGVHGARYGATANEARQCQGEDVYIVGSANSAGQAALNFSRFAKRVVMVVRGDALEKSMSQYLVDRIRETDNIEVRLGTEVISGQGNGHLELITLANREHGIEEEVATNWLFVFIGASPRTEWLGSDVARDEKGFVITGQDLTSSARASLWSLARAPYALETNMPGVFAAGDVRLDSMKRVASAVGEGAMAVHLIHRYLATM